MTNFDEMKNRVSVYSITKDLKPFFENLPRHTSQPAPKDWFKSDYPFVLDWFREGEGWLVQCAFSLIPDTRQNNHYFIWIYDWTHEKLYHVILSSHTVYPPVWNREFGGLDYTDYVSIQTTVKNIMTQGGVGDFSIDETLEGKWVHMTKESPAEVEAILAAGGSYSILSLKAEAARDKLKVKSIEPQS
jgi:hypothetical protein